VDQAPPRTLLEQLVRASRRTIEENCAAFERTAENQGENVTLSPRQLWRWVAGRVDNARPVAQRVAELHWGYAFEALVGPPQLLAPHRRQAVPGDGYAQSDARSLGPSVLQQLELLRCGVHDAISTGSMTDAGLDEWEQVVVRHGQATRYRPAGVLLAELAADFAELQRVLARRQTSAVLRRLTRVTAQMAGLMFLTLIELNVPLAARDWARTAHVAADETGDPAIRSWVSAQEAYVHYYGGNLIEALDVASQAQALAGPATCVGVPLATALEARALAALGRDADARSALFRAEAAVAALDADSLPASAFGYNEAQLRFHEGSTLTQLRDTKNAWTAQDRALDLYPTSDYLDRTLLQLDRASCRIHDGDVPAAMVHATQTLVDLSDNERTGMILLRGQRILGSLSMEQRALPAAREYRDLMLALTGEGSAS
jgi:tetratricopeptide (TPR) repeat protein